MKEHRYRKIAVILTLGFLGAWFASLSTALAAYPDEVILEMPVQPLVGKQEVVPTTCGPLISDTSLPIKTHSASMQFLWAWPITRANFTPNWRQVSAKGDLSSLNMAVKFTYGPAKNLEINLAVPYIHNFASHYDHSLVLPNYGRAADYGGIDDISAEVKYLVLPESEMRPAVAGVFGMGFPSGHASHLNPGRLGTDAIGSGAFTFTTGVNLYKWLKPFLVYSNIWINTPVNLFKSRNDAVRSRESVICNLAAEYPITQRWVALLEFYSTWTWTNISTPQGFQSTSTVLGVLSGIEFLATPKWSFAAGTSIDLVGKAGSAKVTPLVTVYYSF